MRRDSMHLQPLGLSDDLRGPGCRLLAPVPPPREGDKVEDADLTPIVADGAHGFQSREEPKILRSWLGFGRVSRSIRTRIFEAIGSTIQSGPQIALDTAGGDLVFLNSTFWHQ